MLYWVGGNGSWTNTSDWVDPDTYPAPAGPPGPSDDVEFGPYVFTTAVPASLITAGSIETYADVLMDHINAALVQVNASSLTVFSPQGTVINATWGVTGYSILDVSGSLVIDSASGVSSVYTPVVDVWNVYGSSASELEAGAVTVGGSGYGDLDVGLGQGLAAPYNQFAPGKAVITGLLTLGNTSTGDGALTLAGSTNSVTAQSEVAIGNGGTGLARVLAGTTFNATGQTVELGALQGANGTAAVAGTFDAGALEVGVAGAGHVNVTAGGAVVSNSGFIGGASTGDGDVNVSGTGASWTSTTGMFVGDEGTGTLEIENGAQVTTAVSGAVDIAVQQGVTGTITLTGATSSFATNGAPLRVGDSGGGTFNIDAGAAFTGGKVDVAESSGSSLLDVNGGQFTATALNVGGGASAAGGTGAVEVTQSKFLVTGNLSLWAAGSIAITAASAQSATGMIVDGGAVNGGTILAGEYGNLEIDGAVTGAGAIEIGNLGFATLKGAVAAGQTVAFQGAMAELRLTAPAGFAATVAGFAANDIIDLSSMTYNTGATAQLAGATLIVTPTTGPAVQLNFNLSGLSSPHFALQQDVADGGTDVVLGGQASPPLVNTDFTNDGKSDLLLQDGDTLAEWLMNGAQVIGGGSVNANLGAGWSVAGAADFDGDGKADILLANTNGAVAEWLMNGTAVSGGGVFQNLGANSGWSVAGVGDFNGDGKADILLANTNGGVAMWEMNGPQVIGGGVFQNLGANSGWSVAGVGDFNGDGKADVLLTNTNGALAMWEMNGAEVIGGGVFQNLGANSGWSVAGVGDFNGDGKADVLLANTNGALAMWEMNGPQVIGGGVFQNLGAGSGWSLAGVGDFNGDGKADLLLHNTNGAVAEWLMNGANVIGGAVIGTVSSPWSVL